MITIQLDTAAIEKALAELLRKTGDIQPVLEFIGDKLVDSTRARFGTSTGPDGQTWAANSEVTLARKGRGKKPLIDSGTLARQIHYAVRGNTLEVGSSMEYAATQQFGARKGAFGVSRRAAPIPWGDIPPRPFMGLSTEDEAMIHQAIRGYIEV